MKSFERTIERKTIPTSSSILIKEGDFTLKNLITEEEKVQAYHLRHRVFCEELGWVPVSENGLEIDDYDKHAVCFGVFNKQNMLLAHLRFLLAEDPFMLENEFSMLIGSEQQIEKGSETVESTRFCVAPDARKTMLSSESGSYPIFMFLLKGSYHWSKKNNVRYVYTVAEHKINRLLCAKGFPCKSIGDPITMQDGTVAVAVRIDWREFEVVNALKRPKMLRWFTQYRSIPAQRQQQQSGVCLQHQAYA